MTTSLMPHLSRRALLRNTGKLSACSIALLAGGGVTAIGKKAWAAAEPIKDVETLNTALIFEHQIIGAYQAGADSGLLRQPALNIALLFQSHHKAHRDALTSAIQKIGGNPVPAKTSTDYGKDLNIAALKTQNDVLELALKLELGAANAYISILPSFEDHELARLGGRLLADESMHWTALASTLAHPLPANAMFFGT